MYDLNDAEPQRGGVIDPCFAKIVGALRPGGIDGPAPTDRGLLKASKSGTDVLMLDWEFTVTEGRNARRKFWQTMVVAGGELNEKGQSKGWNITKSQLRAMIDSALGLNPKDESDAARQRRMLRGFADLNGITFVAKIGVKKDKESKYPDQNVLAHVVTPDEREWQMVMSGQEVPAAGAPAQAQAQAQGWGQPAWGSAPVAAPVAQAQPQPWGAPPPAASAPVAPSPQPGWPAPAPAPAAQPQSAPSWPPAAAPVPAAPLATPAPAQGWPAPQQPGGWPPAAPTTLPAAMPAVAPTTPGAMPGPAWLNS